MTGCKESAHGLAIRGSDPPFARFESVAYLQLPLVMQHAVSCGRVIIIVMRAGFGVTLLFSLLVTSPLVAITGDTPRLIHPDSNSKVPNASIGNEESPRAYWARGLFIAINRAPAGYTRIYVDRAGAGINPWGVHYVDYAGDDLLMPAPSHFVFHRERKVSMWDGVWRPLTEPGPGYDVLFTADTELGEIAPAGDGRYLVPERWNARAAGAHVLEFDANGLVRRHRLPEVEEPGTGRVIGARHIELLGDRCTLLYTNGFDGPSPNRVRRMDLCTGAALPDFVQLPYGQYAGVVRQLPGGDILVANDTEVLQFDGGGKLRHAYPFERVRHIALTPDGKSFWALGLPSEPSMPSEAQGMLRLYDLSAPFVVRPAFPVINWEANAAPATELIDLAIVGEWRAAVARSRTRSIRR
jgi:hypothetical protein